MNELSVLARSRQDDIISTCGVVSVDDIFNKLVANAEHEPYQERLHEPIEFRSIFVSDVHIGTLSSCSAELAQFFIHTINAKYIYLVGDIFEEHLPNRLVSAADELFLQKLMRAARKGAKVVAFPGNHDTFLRKYANVLRAHNFLILEEACHRTVDGQHFLVTHGDQFDILMRWPWLTVLGTRIYEILCKASVRINRARQISWIDRTLNMMGVHRDWSLSHHIKTQSDQMAYSTNAGYIKTMIRYLFERNAEISKRYHEAGSGGDASFRPIFFDGLIGGHSHIADRKRFLSPLDRNTDLPVGPREITYFNTGHWTGRPKRLPGQEQRDSWRLRLKNPTCTAVVEYPDGRMAHVQWVPGKGIVPLTRYEEQEVAPIKPDSLHLDKKPPDYWKHTTPAQDALAARSG